MERLEDTLYETTVERNSIARSVGAERASNGMVKSGIPTKKEYDEKCGEVVTYNYGVPMRWKQYKQWDDAHRREYLETLSRKYEVSSYMLAEMFGVSQRSIMSELRLLKIKFPGKRTGLYKAEWKRFLSSISEKTEENTKQEGTKVQEESKKEILSKSEDTVKMKERSDSSMSITINSGEITGEGVLSETLSNVFTFLVSYAPRDVRLTVSWEKLSEV